MEQFCFKTDLEHMKKYTAAVNSGAEPVGALIELLVTCDKKKLSMKRLGEALVGVVHKDVFAAAIAQLSVNFVVVFKFKKPELIPLLQSQETQQSS